MEASVVKTETQERIGTRIGKMMDKIIRSQKMRMTEAGFLPTWHMFIQSQVWHQMSSYLTPEYQSLYQELWDKVKLSED